MAERGKEERSEQIAKLDQIIAKHEDLIPTGKPYAKYYTNFLKIVHGAARKSEHYIRAIVTLKTTIS